MTEEQAALTLGLGELVQKAAETEYILHGLHAPRWSERRGTWVYYRVEPSVLAAMGKLLTIALSAA